jgi:hypothetical protein
MSHCIQVILAKEEIINNFCQKWVHARKLSLKQGFALIPMTTSLKEDIEELINNQESDSYEKLEHFSASIEELVKEESGNGAIVWFETNYSGGSGKQSAILYKNQQTEGPFNTVTTWDNIKLELTDKPAGERAINNVLHKLGVYSKYRDEFGVLNLPQLGSEEKILKKIKEQNS